MSNKNPNTSRIVELAKEKTLETEKKVFSTIKKMFKDKKVINYNTVARESSVSKSFLYKNESIKKKISLLRNEQSNLIDKKNYKPNTSEKSKDVIIESLKYKIEKLEKENKELKKAMVVNYKDYYENL